MKEMCSLLRDVNKDIKFGLRFAVHGYNDATFSRLVDSILGLQGEREDGVRRIYVCPTEDARLTEYFHRRQRSRRETHFGPTVHWEQQMMAMSKSGDCYAHWRSDAETHELWMSATLARLDWSQVYFEVPATK